MNIKKTEEKTINKEVLMREKTHKDCKSKIIEMVNEIEDENYLNYLYILMNTLKD